LAPPLYHHPQEGGVQGLSELKPTCQRALAMHHTRELLSSEQEEDLAGFPSQRAVSAVDRTSPDSGIELEVLLNSLTGIGQD
jgi:hypothetical protein